MSAVQYSLYHVPEADFWKARVHKELKAPLSKTSSTATLDGPAGPPPNPHGVLAYWSAGLLCTSTMDPQQLFARQRRQNGRSPLRARTANRIPGAGRSSRSVSPGPSYGR